MIDVSKLPAVRAQLERDLATRAEPPVASSPASVPVEYARAPVTTGGQLGAGRPPAIQETIR